MLLIVTHWCAIFLCSIVHLFWILCTFMHFLRQFKKERIKTKHLANIGFLQSIASFNLPKGTKSNFQHFSKFPNILISQKYDNAYLWFVLIHGGLRTISEATQKKSWIHFKFYIPFFLWDVKLYWEQMIGPNLFSDTEYFVRSQVVRNCFFSNSTTNGTSSATSETLHLSDMSAIS